MILKIVLALLITSLTTGIFARTTNINLQSRKNRYEDFFPKRNDFIDHSNLLIMYGISPRDSNTDYEIDKDNFIREDYHSFGPYSRVILQTIIKSNADHNYNSRRVSTAFQQPYYRIYVINYPESVHDDSKKVKLYLNKDYNIIYRRKRQIPQTMHELYNNEETSDLPLRDIRGVRYSTIISSSNPDTKSKNQGYPIQNAQIKILTYRTVTDEDSEDINLNTSFYTLRNFPKNLQVIQRNFEQPFPIINSPYNRKSYRIHQSRRHHINEILSSGDLFIYPWHYNKEFDANNGERNFLLLQYKFKFPVTLREPFQGNSLIYQNGKALLNKLRQDEAFDAYSSRAVTDTVKNSHYDYPYYDFTGLKPNKNIKY